MQEEVDNLIYQRYKAKLSKDYSTADEIRQLLLDLNVGIKDNKDGTIEWSIRNKSLPEILNVNHKNLYIIFSKSPQNRLFIKYEDRKAFYKALWNIFYTNKKYKIIKYFAKHKKSSNKVYRLLYKLFYDDIVHHYQHRKIKTLFGNMPTCYKHPFLKQKETRCNGLMKTILKEWQKI